MTYNNSNYSGGSLGEFDKLPYESVEEIPINEEPKKSNKFLLIGAIVAVAFLLF